MEFGTLCQEYETFAAIRNRRSVRRFADREVSDGMIEALIQAAAWAPSAWNLQPWRFVVVRDRKVRATIARKAYAVLQASQPDVESFEEMAPNFGHEAPVQVFFFNDTRELSDPRVITECRASCVAAVQNLLLAAQVLGLGACWQGEPLLARDVLVRLLCIPPGVDPVASVCLGHPEEAPEAPPRRQGLRDVLFKETMS